MPEFGKDSSRDPKSLVADSIGRLVAVDRGAETVRRFGLDRVEDLAFAAAAASGGSFIDPRFVAIGVGDWVLVADAGREEVLVLDDAGNWLGALAAPEAGWRPRAVLAVGSRLYVADAATGRIWLMDGPSGRWLGSLRGWRGPVAAMAATAAGDLLIKTGPAPEYYRLPHDAAHLASGWIAAGPFDAGIENGWHVLRVQADVPDGARLTASAALRPDTNPPVPADWHDLPGPKGLLELLTQAGASLTDRRFLWLRLDLESLDPPATPILRQVEAATSGERLIDYLPAVYAREDGSWSDPPEAGTPRAFLRRLLELLGDGLFEAEGMLDLFARRLDPQFAPAADLRWLAEWLALDLPRRLEPAAWRHLLGRAVSLHARGGTPASLAEMARLETGLAIRIEESFQRRGVWLLGAGQGLGFDTMLPVIDPEGLVLEGEGPRDGQCRTYLGGAVLAATTPIAEADVFTPLFAPWAHRFAVTVAPASGADSQIAALRDVLDREKPAHTDYVLCPTRPALRVGFQARLGIDTIVASGPPAGRLDEARLGRDSRIAGSDQTAAPGGRVGTGVIGQGLRLG